MRFLALLALFFIACDDTTSNHSASDAGTDAQPDTPSAEDAGSDADPTICAPGIETTYEGTQWTFVAHADGSWTASQGDVVLQGPSPCDAPSTSPIRLMDGTPSVRTAFGNFQIDLFADSATWSAPQTVQASASEDGLDLSYGFADGRAATLSLRDNGRFQVNSPSPGAEWSFVCSPSEGFFGLGSQVTGMDLRGRTYPLWTQEQGNGKREDGGLFPFNNTLEAAYAPMGVLHSSAGWTGLLTHDAYSEVDLCSNGHVSLRSFAGQPGFQMLTGTPKQRMKGVSTYVGTPPDVPDWAFGLWLDAVGGPWRVETVANRLRENGIPASAIWTEDWIGGSSTAAGYRLSYAWEWDQTYYPDLPAQIANLHDRGFAFLAYFNPFVPKTTRMFDEGETGGFLIQNPDGTPTIFGDPGFRDASMVDLTNPSALQWLKDYQLTAIEDLGIDGWMADFAEWLPVETTLANGQDPWTFHNPYPVAWQQANRDAFQQARPDGNWSFFVRSGWASVNGGTGGVAPLFWAGDQNTNWAYDDGFPTIIPIGTHVGLSGVAVFGSDIAGYNSFGEVPTTTKELWFRWLATAAFHPLMRTHHGGRECDNWHFDRDQESTDHMRRYATVHAMLLPEFKRLFAQAQADGLPITRHPWLVEPDVPAMWSSNQYQFFMGDNLLVAPVLAPETQTRPVVFPGPGWWPLFGTTPLASAQTDATAQTTEIPVFVRPGTALVMLSEAPDSFYGGNVTTLDDVAGYRVALYPDTNGNAATAPTSPISIQASGLTETSITALSLDGNALEPCNPARETCIDGDLVKVRCETTCTLSNATTQVEINVTTPTTVWLGTGGTAWGDLRTPTPFTPSLESGNWCSEE